MDARAIIRSNSVIDVGAGDCRLVTAVLYGRTFSFQCDIDGSNIRQIRIRQGRSWLNLRRNQEAKWVPRLEAAIKAKLTRG
jgi:predicted RNA methylase